MAKTALEDEGDSLCFEGGFFFGEIFFREAVEAAVGAELGEEGVHPGQQLVVALAQGDGPGLGLQRAEQGAGGARVAFGVLEDGHLVVDEGVGFALRDFKDAGAFFVEGEDTGLAEVGAGEDFAGGALADDDAASGLVEIFKTLRGAGGGQQGAETGGEVGVGEGHRFGAFGGGGHGGDDDVDFAGLEGGDESGEGNIFDDERAAEMVGEGLGDFDRDAGGLAVRADCFEGRVGKIHADAEGRGIGSGRGEDRGEKQDWDAHGGMGIGAADGVNNSVLSRGDGPVRREKSALC